MPTDAPPLTDAGGTVLADVLLDDAIGVRWAILTTHAPAAAVAPAVLARLRGHRVVTEDGDLADLLVAAGGRVQRRAHDYAYDLDRVPEGWAEWPAPQGFRLSRDLDPDALAPSYAAAYPPSHPDHEPGLDRAAELRAMLAGEVIGPNVPAATWQAEDGDGPCGAVLVVERPSRTYGVRTWVVEVFVDPRCRGTGLGGALLRRALAGAAGAGYRETGLVVTDGNRARLVYESLGFRLVRSGTNVDVPLLS